MRPAERRICLPSQRSIVLLWLLTCFYDPSPSARPPGVSVSGLREASPQRRGGLVVVRGYLTQGADPHMFEFCINTGPLWQTTKVKLVCGPICGPESRTKLSQVITAACSVTQVIVEARGCDVIHQQITDKYTQRYTMITVQGLGPTGKLSCEPVGKPFKLIKRVFTGFFL